ncbi:hypothetical protein KSH_09120 [Moraxella osloensis]|nr:hypothetical protein [Moraxella osloensis]ATQ85949.1 hypothetical protein KSH_09120 [Moraxella osloensis]
MKKFNFNPNVLTAGVALALGLGIATGVSASTSSGSASPSGGVQISNTATAEYSVDGVAQPTVTSNAVIVNVSEIGSFTLYGTQGTSSTDDKNESQAAIPGGTTTFTNRLTNTGNVTDTYTLNLTTNNDASIATGNQDYQFTSPTAITYAIYNTDGSVATTLASSQTQTGTVNSTGGTIKLLPGQYADLTYNVTSPTTVTGGQSGVGTLTATSSYITTTGGATATLVNENQAIIKLPVFAIQKTAASTSIDLNTTSPTVDYTITVKNDGSATYAADAVGVLIQDKLPTGLTVSGGASAITVTSTDSTTTNGTTPTLTTSAVDGRQIIAINGVALKVNETMTITFTAAIDKTKVNKAGVTNTAEVYDNYNDTAVTPGDNPTSDIKDSSGTSNPTDAKVPNDPTGTGAGGDTSTPITFSDRSLTLTGSTSAELPPTSTSTGVTYTQTITNTGNNPETGLTFTISNPSTTDNITPRNVIYTPQGGTAVTLTPDANGVYTIPGSIGSGQTGTITYDVVTTGATIGTSETNTITLIPAAVTGTTKPTVTPVTNTTTVRGMTLVKEQALDATCDKTPDTAFAQTPVTATPGQCIVYKITATNTMTTKQLTNVVISDTASQWNTKATYVAGSIFDSANGATVVPGSSAQSSSLTLAANGGTGYLQFVVKINGAN